MHDFIIEPREALQIDEKSKDNHVKTFTEHLHSPKVGAQYFFTYGEYFLKTKI